MGKRNSNNSENEQNLMPINFNNIPINMQINTTNLNFPLNFLANQNLGNNLNQSEYTKNIIPKNNIPQVIYFYIFNKYIFFK